jgi:hypothetical protein
MVASRPAFVFTPSEAARLMADIGRNDVSAVAFISDVEACLRAFNFVATEETAQALPTNVAENLAAIVQTTAQLRSALYALPDEIAMLIDLHILSDGARRRIAADLAQLVEPLEDMASAIAEIQQSAKGNAAHEHARLENRLVAALAMAFRNRLNRRPTSDPQSDFPEVLADILDFAARRLPGIAAARSALTTTRLGELIGHVSKRERLGGTA